MVDTQALRRYQIKTVRDKAKAAYKKDDHCHICDTTEELQLHHYHGLQDLWTMWCRKNKIKIESTEDVEAHRDLFIAQHHDELYNEVVTLCKTHHMELHQVFGKSPSFGSAKAQNKWVTMKRKRWLDKQSLNQ